MQEILPFFGGMFLALIVWWVVWVVIMHITKALEVHEDKLCLPKTPIVDQARAGIRQIGDDATAQMRKLSDNYLRDVANQVNRRKP